MSVKFGKYRYFKSKLNDLYLEIKDGVDEPGIVVVTAEKRAGGDTDCQIWYEDPLTGTIRSKLNEYCLDINCEYTGQPHFKNTAQHCNRDISSGISLCIFK